MLFKQIRVFDKDFFVVNLRGKQVLFIYLYLNIVIQKSKHFGAQDRSRRVFDFLIKQRVELPVDFFGR
jgi:hypothetical protein